MVRFLCKELFALCLIFLDNCGCVLIVQKRFSGCAELNFWWRRWKRWRPKVLLLRRFCFHRGRSLILFGGLDIADINRTCHAHSNNIKSTTVLRAISESILFDFIFP